MYLFFIFCLLRNVHREITTLKKYGSPLSNSKKPDYLVTFVRGFYFHSSNQTSKQHDIVVIKEFLIATVIHSKAQIRRSQKRANFFVSFIVKLLSIGGFWCIGTWNRLSVRHNFSLWLFSFILVLRTAAFWRLPKALTSCRLKKFGADLVSDWGNARVCCSWYIEFFN